MTHLSDEELIEIYKKSGNNEAFETILTRYKNSLFSFLVRMVSDKTVSEDLFQEVFFRVIKSLPDYKSKDKFKSWIFRIANNLAIDHLRSIKRRKTSSIEEEIFEEKGKSIKVEDTLKSASHGPEKILEHKELQHILKNSIESLTEEQKEIFILRHESKMSFKEIADLLKCPLNTALGRMHCAMKKLKEKLTEELEV
ncbi:MAG: sigma-70 family RNA polymerase sigma factor [Candidatus Eremiobacterota bacterium]